MGPRSNAKYKIVRQILDSRYRNMDIEIQSTAFHHTGKIYFDSKKINVLTKCT